MKVIKADVWVITEPLLTFSPGAEYRLVAHSYKAADIESGTDPKWAADRRWVAIWSKLPARKLEVLTEPDRMACIRVEQPGQRDVVIVGTVLPWFRDTKWPSNKGKGYSDALQLQVAEWVRLWGMPPAAAFCVAGDFNQSLPYKRYYGLPESAKRLQQLLVSLGLRCLTGDDVDPLPVTAGGRPSIDHICVSSDLLPSLTPPSRTWTIPCKANSSVAITDHFGASSELNVCND